MEQQHLFTPSEIKKVLSKGKKGEENLQLALCDYLRKNYPGVIWFCDLASGMKLPIWVAVRNSKMRSSRGLPDLFIAVVTPDHNGMFLEIKKEGVKLFNKNGVGYDKHIREQDTVLKQLRTQSYLAEFGVGYDDCVSKIDMYMSMAK